VKSEGYDSSIANPGAESNRLAAGLTEYNNELAHYNAGHNTTYLTAPAFAAG
jgi:hypothetical protein